MPNWCDGVVKFRGNLPNICDFIEHEFMNIYYDVSPTEMNKVRVEKNVYKTEIYVYKGKRQIYIDNREGVINSRFMAVSFKSLGRVISDFVLSGEDITGDILGRYVVALPVSHAWGVRVEDYVIMAKLYGIDIKGVCRDSAMEFEQRFEVNKAGEVLENECIKFECYLWDCENPLIGG